ncbi:hypothetical protein V8F20_012060 [Naviculisporaceae sp. PSN 640]
MASTTLDSVSFPRTVAVQTRDETQCPKPPPETKLPFTIPSGAIIIDLTDDREDSDENNEGSVEGGHLMPSRINEDTTTCPSQTVVHHGDDPRESPTTTCNEPDADWSADAIPAIRDTNQDKREDKTTSPTGVRHSIENDDKDDWEDEDVLILGSDGSFHPVETRNHQPPRPRYQSVKVRLSPAVSRSRVPTQPTLYPASTESPWANENRPNIIELFQRVREEEPMAIKVARKAVNDPDIVDGVFQMVFFPDGSVDQTGNDTRPSEA